MAPTWPLFVLFTEIGCKPPGRIFWMHFPVYVISSLVHARALFWTASPQSHWHLPAAHSICFFMDCGPQLVLPINWSGILCATLVSISHLHLKKILNTDDNSYFIPGSSLLCDPPLGSQYSDIYFIKLPEVHLPTEIL